MFDLSIVLPNFNSGELLEESLKSIFSNKVSFSFEVLVIDNCSSDHPELIIEKFPFDNLFFFSEPDLGIYDAMNKGINIAKGDWLFFLGAGDKVEFNNLESVLNKYNTCLGIIYGDVVHSKFNLVIGGEFNLKRILRINLCHQGILFSKSIFENKIRFSLKYPILSDYFFNLRLFFDKSISKIYVNTIFSYYRGGGISEIKKDILFNKDKNRIIIQLLIENLSFNSLFDVLKYYKAYLTNKLILIRNRISQ